MLDQRFYITSATTNTEKARGIMKVLERDLRQARDDGDREAGERLALVETVIDILERTAWDISEAELRMGSDEETKGGEEAA